MTAAGAFGMMVFDAALYAARRRYAETARAWRDPWFFANRRFWRGSPLFGNAFGDSDSARHVAVEMGDPTGGGRYEVLEDDADERADDSEEDDENRNQPSTSATSSSFPVRRLRRRAKLVTSIKLEDVRAEDDAAEDDVRDDDVGSGSGSRGSADFSRRRSVSSARPAVAVASATAAVVVARVVDGVTVSAHDGQVLALLGHAGSGASETLEVMSGRRPAIGGFGGISRRARPRALVPRAFRRLRRSVSLARRTRRFVDPEGTPRVRRACTQADDIVGVGDGDERVPRVRVRGGQRRDGGVAPRSRFRGGPRAQHAGGKSGPRGEEGASSGVGVRGRGASVRDEDHGDGDGSDPRWRGSRGPP